MKNIGLLLILFGLLGCATLSEDECRSSNWYELGLKNGKEGKPLLNRHNEACQEYGIVPDTVKYDKGFRDGIGYYCTPENGYREGVAGNSYNKVCPLRMEKAFLTKYKIGKKIHGYKAEYDSTQSEIDRLNNELATVDASSSRYSQIKHQIYMKRGELDSLKKKLIFLKARSGYDLEDIVDFF